MTAFVGATSVPRQRCVKVYAAKGKGKSQFRVQQQTSLAGQMRGQVVEPEAPPIDPENEEFVIFFRTKEKSTYKGLPQPTNKWRPLSMVKGGQAANALVKYMQTEWGRKLYSKTLIRNIAEPVYKDKQKLIKNIKSEPSYGFVYQSVPAKEFEFGFKVRDRSDPKSWRSPVNMTVLPAEEELTNVQDDIKRFFSADNLKSLFA